MSLQEEREQLLQEPRSGLQPLLLPQSVPLLLLALKSLIPSKLCL